MNTDLFVAILLDRSGSMGSIQLPTIEAFNGFLDGLREQPGRTLVTLTQFDSESIDILYEARAAASAPRLTTDTYLPRAGTPLYDAAGETLSRTEQRVKALGWAGNVLIVFVTDGLENASREWTRERVFARVKELEDRDWSFLYLGAHTDAYVASEAMGVSAGNTARWKKSARGAAQMGEQLSTSAAAYRTNVRDKKQLILEQERRKLEREE